MSHDRRRPGRLPEHPEYWANLARRSIEAAFAQDLPAEAAPAWWVRIADAAPALAAMAVLALLAGAVLLGDRPAPPAPDAIAGALLPDEPMLRTLLLEGNAPPPASTFVDLVALRENEP